MRQRNPRDDSDGNSGVHGGKTKQNNNMVEPYKIPATLNIPSNPGEDLGPRKDGEPGDNVFAIPSFGWKSHVDASHNY